MPGMNSGINANDPTVTAAFRAALVHQGLVALVIFVLIALLWGTSKAWLPARAEAAAAARGAGLAWAAEAAARGPGGGAGAVRRARRAAAAADQLRAHLGVRRHPASPAGNGHRSSV